MRGDAWRRLQKAREVSSWTTTKKVTPSGTRGRKRLWGCGKCKGLCQESAADILSQAMSPLCAIIMWTPTASYTPAHSAKWPGMVRKWCLKLDERLEC